MHWEREIQSERERAPYQNTLFGSTEKCLVAASPEFCWGNLITDSLNFRPYFFLSGAMAFKRSLAVVCMLPLWSQMLLNVLDVLMVHWFHPLAKVGNARKYACLMLSCYPGKALGVEGTTVALQSCSCACFTAVAMQHIDALSPTSRKNWPGV